jgi:hypothetical protein
LNYKWPLLVTNLNDNTVSQVSSNGTVSSYILSGNFLSQPMAIVFDSNNNLFISSIGSNSITKYGPGITTATGYWVQDNTNLNGPYGKKKKKREELKLLIYYKI